MPDGEKIKLSRDSSWFLDNGYLTIDLELFGRNLADIFTKFFEETYYYQTFMPLLMTDRARPSWEWGEELKHLAVITPNSYDYSSENYNKIRKFYGAYHTSLYPKTMEPSMFSKDPLKLDDKDFLLYFGYCSCENSKVSLGYVKEGEFIPNDFFHKKLTTEVDYQCFQYSFVDDYIKEIFYYKIIKKKPNLEQSDMDLILKKFGINRKDEIRKFVRCLKIMEGEYRKILFNNKIESVMSLKRIMTNDKK